jgi:hypothetical protein
MKHRGSPLTPVRLPSASLPHHISPGEIATPVPGIIRPVGRGLRPFSSSFWVSTKEGRGYPDQGPGIPWKSPECFHAP